MADIILDFTKPRLFAPSTVRTVIGKPGGVRNVTLNDMASRNFGNTGSFRYDGPQEGLKSTQQLGLDFSKFENHTFFNSAQSKVNVAFDRIINFFPFDSNRRDIEIFMDSLTGFENYVFQKIPKYKGYINFSGSAAPKTTTRNGGSYIKIKDAAGSAFPDYSKDDTGQTVLNPHVSSFTLDMHIFIPLQHTSGSVVCQMMGKKAGSSGAAAEDRGFVLGFKSDGPVPEGTTSTTSSIFFAAVSGSKSLFTSASFEKGRFNRVVATYDRQSSDTGRLNLYINTRLRSKSADVNLGDFFFHSTEMLIGSGTKVKKIQGEIGEPGTVRDWTPTATFSGSIDELRFFHSVRDVIQQKSDNTKNIYPMEHLKLYYKFNEPTGSHSLSSVVLDSSGNSLHSEITNFSLNLRVTGSLVDPLADEDVNVSPILFPGYPSIKSLLSDMLLSGSQYDDVNPNLITRLIPNHYLQDGKKLEGLETQDAGITQPFSGKSMPGSGQLTSSQLIISFLLVWAKFFDEIKMFIDEFSSLTFIDYDSDISVPDQFLYFAGKYYGIDLPRIFSDPSIAQYVNGENLKVDLSKSSSSLHHVQNEIWRRILTNLPHIVRSKGTIKGIKALIRSIGIHPENNFRIREYGGPVKRQLFDRTEQRSEISTLIDFSGSLGDTSRTGSVAEPLSAQGFHPRMPHITSSYLSGARIEPGRPFVGHGSATGEVQGFITDARWAYYKKPPAWPYQRLPEISPGRPGRSPVDGGWRGPGLGKRSFYGLLTSGSWTYEAIYKLPTRLTGVYAATQSLARLMCSGTRAPSTQAALLFNLIATSGSQPTLSLFGKPTSDPMGDTNAQEEPIVMHLTGVNLFDGNKWNVSFGRERADLIQNEVVPLTASVRYFLRAARSKYGGGVLDFNVTKSFYGISQDGRRPHNTNVLNRGGPGYYTWHGLPTYSQWFNFSGSYIAIGSQSLYVNNDSTGLVNSPNRFLNRTDYKNSADSSVKGNTKVDMRGNKETRFEGQFTHMRWWSKALTEKEWRRHVVSFKSLGVHKPLKNFNFSLWEDGSWERLRLDISTDQVVTQSNSEGKIKLIDFSQNKKDPVLYASGVQVGFSGPAIDRWGNYSFTGRGFEPNKQIIKPERFHFASLSPKFDQRESDTKVRVRGYTNREKVRDSIYAEVAPVYEIQPWLEPDDDIRFGIEFSAVQALDEDIMGIFADLGFFNDAIGDPALMFADFYPDIEQLRKIYFNRLNDKVNFKTLFDFFKWFDTTFSSIIEQIIPRKVNFLGINYVIESHVLERPKMRYLQDEIYLKLKDRDIVEGTLDSGGSPVGVPIDGIISE